MREFNELYKEYSNGIYKYLYYLTGNKDDSEELLQETFLQAFRSIEKFRGDCSVSTWLYAIAKNCYYKYLRKKKDHISLDNIEEIRDSNTPEIELEKLQEISRVRHAVRSLDEPFKEVVILRSINELSFKDIGYILQKNENWARVTFHRAKAKLGKELKE